VTFARAFTDTFSGIRPSDVPGFIVAEIAGAVAAIIMFRWLLPNACTGVGDVKPTAKSGAG
jgi:glycerol uptake facilitator-like aquaporin